MTAAISVLSSSLFLSGCSVRYVLLLAVHENLVRIDSQKGVIGRAKTLQMYPEIFVHMTRLKQLETAHWSDRYCDFYSSLI